MPNLNDVVSWIQRIEDKLDRLKSGAFLEQASITKGLLRIIGGLLRIDSGGRLEGEGHFGWSGPIYLDGDVEVTKTLDVTAATRLRGETTIEGIARLLSELVVEGKITAGKIRIENGTVFVGEGANQIVIDGATGKITAGKLTIDPTKSGGAVTFENGAEVFTDTETIQLFKGNSVVQVGDDYARLQNGGDVVEIDGDGVRVSPGAVPVSTTPEAGHWMQINPTTGRLVRVPPGVGGPDGGAFDYPFPESTISDTFRPPNRPNHNGLDFAGPQVTGFMIPAAARGVVTFAGGSPTVTETSGYGYYVIVNHGIINGHTVETRYAHMATQPTVAVGQTVAKGALLGPVGNTGNSFGDHLHWEILVDGEPVDPQVFMQQYGG